AVLAFEFAYATDGDLGESTLSRWERGAATAAPPGTARAPAIDLSALRELQTPGEDDAPPAPLGRIAAADRPHTTTRAAHAETADQMTAMLALSLAPASRVAPDADATRWARNAAAMLGTMYLSQVHVVSRTRGARVVELEGFGDGCDPPPAWV